MCERFVVDQSFESLAAHYTAAGTAVGWAKNYNVAASHAVPVIIEEDGTREIILMRWGLIPFWAKDAKIAAKMINAPAETIEEKPGFRDVFKTKRCLVPASGFYGWMRFTKDPYLFTPASGLLTFAGLWSQWVNTDSVQIETFSIVTTAANQTVKTVQDRMPLILDDARTQAAWLSPATKVKELKEILARAPDTAMIPTPVSTYVNSPKNTGPKCIEPLVG